MIAERPPAVDDWYAFTFEAARALAGIPARIVKVHYPLKSGGWLVALEYSEPVPYAGEMCRHLDARSTDLWCVREAQA